MVELIDFYADWCAPCKIMEPVIDEIKKEIKDQVKITKINVDQNQEVASKYGVMSIPTFVLLKDEKEADRLIGATSKENLTAKIKSLIS